MKKSKLDTANERLIDKERELQRLRGEVEQLAEELAWARDKLAEAQTRIRKLNWLIQQGSGEMRP